jgi:hypothetical protein
MSDNHNDVNDFECDECKVGFKVGQGFLGSMDDFEFQMSDRDESFSDFECNPFMDYVQLCNECYNKRKNN